MESFSLQKNLCILSLFIFLLWGCKQPEKVVIGDAPTVSAPSDTADYTDDDEGDFRKLVIGESQPISSFDPLLADNPASMRALQLIYEGLVRMDAKGDVTAAAAKNWDVSNDSLTYTFTINRDTYYHDSDVFNTGTGRRLAAEDVKFVFERMAKAGHPKTAAKLFWNIKGFEPFYQEQNNVYESQKRTLSEVSGIQAKNDSTVIFELHEEDPDFLKKLSTPYALIYPREAVGAGPDDFAAVGTGPFTLSPQNNDTAFVFAKSEQYKSTSNIRINRVDVLTSDTDSELINQFEKGDIHFLPELSPNMIGHFTTDEGELKSEFQKRYNFTIRKGADEYVVRSNPNANISEDDAKILSHIAHADTSSSLGQLPDSIISAAPLNYDQESVDTTLTVNELYAVFSDDPFARMYHSKLAEKLAEQEIQLEMTEFRTPTRTTDLWITTHYPLVNERTNTLDGDFPSLFRFKVHPTALQRDEIADLNFNSYGWWLNLRGVSLPTLDNLN